MRTSASTVTPGVDPLAVGRALYQNSVSWTVRSGASTLTMQVARMMRPKPRTWFNKAVETLLALKIELYYAKDDILRLYLDHCAVRRQHCRLPGCGPQVLSARRPAN